MNNKKVVIPISISIRSPPKLNSMSPNEKIYIYNQSSGVINFSARYRYGERFVSKNYYIVVSICDGKKETYAVH